MGNVFGGFVIELIQELKQKCRFDSEIGHSLDLREKEITFLSAIADDSGITSKELSEIAGLSPSRASRVISSLHDKGFIELEHDSSDRRLINISLTEKGNSCAAGIRKKKEECESNLLRGLSDYERTIVKQGLNILLGKM